MTTYKEARQALSQHLHRHHNQAWATGTLAERIETHDELHTVGKRLGRPANHSHKPWKDDETLEQIAVRYLREGTEQYGQTNVTTDS